MSKIRPKQDIEGKWRNRSNVFKKLKIKTLKELWYMAPMGKWLLENQVLKMGWLHMQKNGEELKHRTTSQQWGCKQRIKNMIMAPHHPKANIGVVLIHQYYQQIIRWQEKQLICWVNKIGGNDTHVRKSKDHKHIGLLMKENLNCQLSCHHLVSIEITCARQVWHFITEPMKH